MAFSLFVFKVFAWKSLSNSFGVLCTCECVCVRVWCSRWRKEGAVCSNEAESGAKEIGRKWQTSNSPFVVLHGNLDKHAHTQTHTYTAACCCCDYDLEKKKKMLTQDVRHRMNLYPECVYCTIEKERGRKKHEAWESITIIIITIRKTLITVSNLSSSAKLSTK